jgi:hypothetical protein
VEPTIRVNTDGLKPGDRVMGSERAELMIGPAGLYVDRILQDASTYGVWVWWRGATQPEFFNPYWSWYIIRKEENNGTT